MTNLTLEEIYCYYHRLFSIVYDGNELNVVRERDKQLIASVPVGRNRDLIKDTFYALKNKYILDYDNACV